MQVSPSNEECFSQSRAKFQPESPASLCVKPAPEQVAYSAATSFKSVAILRLPFRRRGFRGGNNFAGKNSLSLSPSLLCALSLSSFFYFAIENHIIISLLI